MKALPTTFPAQSLTETEKHKVLWFYRRYVEDYYREYQFGHFILAAYAAVPALLTPDLLYKIWQNFHGYEWSKSPTSIHRIAVSDVLLSPMCREVGYELYEMQHDIRLSMQSWLLHESGSELWLERGLAAPSKIAEFVAEYHRKPNPGHQRWGDGYLDLQSWSVLAYGQYDQLQRELAAKLRNALALKKHTAALRIMDVWTKTGLQLDKLTPAENAADIQKFQQNARFVEAWKALMQQDVDMFLEKFSRDARATEMLSDLEEGGIAVNIPGDKLSEIESLAPPTIWAVVVAIDQYHPESGIGALTGCVNDAKAFIDFLHHHSAQKKLPLQIRSLLDQEATYQAVRESIDFYKNIRNGDYCLFHFSGHVESHKIPDNKGRRFLFHDSRVNGIDNDLSQGILEETIYPLLADKTVQCLWIFDTHEAGSDELRKGLLDLPLRKNAQNLKGSLVILNATKPGQVAYEKKNKQGETSGVFSDTLLEVLAENGTALSYRALLEKVKLRILQSNDNQTPFWEAFPGFAANYLFLSNQLDSKVAYKIVFEPEAREWRLKAGTQQGITASLGFMNTYLRLKDDRNVIVRDVFPEYATLLDFNEENFEKSFDAFLVQTALPKVKIAFDPKVSDAMRSRFLAAKERYDLYYIDLIEKTAEAKYIIRCQNAESKTQPDDTFYLTRKASEFEDPTAPERPVFTQVRDGFEFIKHLEYIAQWTGVLEYDNASAVVKKDSVNVTFETIEGQHFTPATLNEVHGTRQGNAESLTLHYQKINGEWVIPAFRCSIEGDSANDLFIHALYLDSTFGILLLKSGRLEKNVTLSRGIGSAVKAFLQIKFEDRGQQYNAIPITINDGFLDQGITEVQEYLKIFISNQEMNLESLVQEGLNFKREISRSAGFSRKSSIDLSGIEWTSLVFPIKVVRKESPEHDEGKNISAEQKLVKSPAIHALLVGINEYHPSLNGNLRASFNDCNLIREWLVGRWANQNITLMLNAEGTARNILEGFRERASIARPSEFVFLFYAGHTTTQQDNTRLGNEVNRYDVMVPFGAYIEKDIIRETLDTREFIHIIKSYPSVNFVLWYDGDFPEIIDNLMVIHGVGIEYKDYSDFVFYATELFKTNPNSTYKELIEKYNNSPKPNLGGKREKGGMKDKAEVHGKAGNENKVIFLESLFEDQNPQNRPEQSQQKDQPPAPKPTSFYPDKNIIRTMIVDNKVRMTNIAWHELLLKVSKAVCRVIDGSNNMATGFLLEGGYLLTSSVLDGVTSKIEVEFNFEYDLNGQFKQPVSYQLDPRDMISVENENNRFIYAKIIDQPDNPLSQWGYLEIEETELPKLGDSVVIIHHPLGEEKKISIDPEGILDITSRHDSRLFYKNDTKQGSIGAPVLNSLLHVVGVHQGGGNQRDPFSKDSDGGNANFGTMIGPIMEEIRRRKQEGSYTSA